MVVLLALSLTACAPAAARAQAPVPPAVPPPPVQPLPVQTPLTLTVQRTGGLRAAALTGARLRVRGTTEAFVPGETITVRFYIAGRKRAARSVALTRRPRSARSLQRRGRSTSFPAASCPTAAAPRSGRSSACCGGSAT
jgi:hypothetical protein